MFFKNYRTIRRVYKNKFIFVISVLFIIIASLLKADIINFNKDIHNNELIDVQLEACIDGDTAIFSEIGKSRFLMIDTSENNTIDGQKASEFTCNILKSTTKIEVLFDENSQSVDRYNRNLVWVIVDGELLQSLIAKNGLVTRFYDHNGRATFDISNINLNKHFVDEVYNYLDKTQSFWRE
jgi:endonuclease YncB( thermonuclease family)